MKRKLKGFTLIELVITIAIVIILSVVSVPIYRGYVSKAKWTEGYALLGTILSSQKTYYSEYGYFFSGTAETAVPTAYCRVLGIDASGNKYFTCFRVGFRGTGFDPKTIFYANLVVPDELIEDNSNASCISLKYNITTGSVFTPNNSF